jgi:hypothetical protein
VSIKNLVTQGELDETITSLTALAENLDQHVNDSLSRAHAWNILDAKYLDTGGNYHTDFSSSSTLQPIPGLYATGVNNDGTLAVDGSVDLHWTVVESASHALPGPNAIIKATSQIPNTWASNQASSKWIGLQENITQQPIENLPNGLYEFQLQFSLTGLNAAQASIILQWTSNDATKAVFLNGNSILPVKTSSTASKSTWPEYTNVITGGFLPGTNTLIIQINSTNTFVDLQAVVSGTAPVGGQLTIPGVLGTGLTTGGALGTKGTTDPNWSLITNPQNSSSTAAIIMTTLKSGWLANTSTAQWIGPLASGSSNAHVGIYVYRLTFSLTGFDPTSALVKGSFAADNHVTQILINGQTVSTTGLSNEFNYLTSFIISTGFHTGSNTLDFYVNNTSTSPTGLIVQVTGSAGKLGDNLISRVLRLSVGSQVLYVPCQASGGLDGTSDVTIQVFTGIVSPQSADPATDITVGSSTPAQLVTTFAAALTAICQAALDTLNAHAGSSAEDAHGGLTAQADNILTSGGFLAGRNSINIKVNGVLYKMMADTHINGPLNA